MYTITIKNKIFNKSKILIDKNYNYHMCFNIIEHFVEIKIYEFIKVQFLQTLFFRLHVGKP